MDFKFNTGDDIFTCTQCGECCRGFGGTYVSKEDIHRISRFIGCDPAEFIPRYCDMSGSRPVLTLADDGKCIFFDKLCTIHAVKPYMCRAWPFIKTLVQHPENWEAMAGSCPGMVKGGGSRTGYPAHCRRGSQKIKCHLSHVGLNPAQKHRWIVYPTRQQRRICM